MESRQRYFKTITADRSLHRAVKNALSPSAAGQAASGPLSDGLVVLHGPSHATEVGELTGLELHTGTRLMTCTKTRTRCKSLDTAEVI